MPKRKPSKNATSNRTVWDSKIRQLGLRKRAGQERWIVKLIGSNGKPSRRTLGLVSDISVDEEWPHSAIGNKSPIMLVKPEGDTSPPI